MSYKVYSDYIASGVKWLGLVPSHWQLKRVGGHFSDRREKVSDKVFPALSVTKNGIVPQLETAAKTDDSDNRKGVYPGDFVINSRSDRKGSSGVSELKGSVSLINTVLKPSATIEPIFSHHLFRSYPFQEEFYRFGKGIVADLWSTNFTQMKNIMLSVPPLDEQRQIAAFLDRECGKMDSLMEKQQKLIALLKEKRQAVITQAVTKGIVNSEFGSLNAHLSGERLKSEERRVKELTTSNFTPQTSNFKKVYTTHTSPLKPTNIQWLGEVPEGWKLTPLKYLGNIISGFAFKSNSFTESGVRVLKIANVQTTILDWSDESFVPYSFYEQHKYFAVRNRDIVFALTRPIISTGLKAAVAQIGSDKVLLNQRNAIFRPANNLNKQFLYHVLFSETFRIDFEDKIDFTGQQPNISPIDIADISIPLPKIEEQQAIASYLDSTCGKIDKLISKAEQAITLLKERRTALISAAVTGKIDVRGETSEGKGRKEKG